MPRFYIDTSDQEHFVRDEEGFEFDTVVAANNAAVEALPDMAQDKLKGNSRTFSAVVRDESGRILVLATMSFGITWMIDEE